MTRLLSLEDSVLSYIEKPICTQSYERFANENYRLCPCFPLQLLRDSHLEQHKSPSQAPRLYASAPSHLQPVSLGSKLSLSPISQSQDTAPLQNRQWGDVPHMSLTHRDRGKTSQSLRNLQSRLENSNKLNSNFKVCSFYTQLNTFDKQTHLYLYVHFIKLNTTGNILF